MKSVLFTIVPFIFFIIIFSITAVHIENIIILGIDGASKYFQYPAIIWPFEATRERNSISIGVAIAAGLAGWAAMAFFDKFIYKRWGLVTKEQYEKIIPNKESK